MNADKQIARSVGSLFIITMILGMIDAYTVAPILNAPLNNISSNEIRVIIGAFSILLMSIGVVFIAILLYPIIEKHNKFIAITYVSFRIMECLLLTVGVIVYLLLIILSQEFLKEGSPDASYFQTIGTLAVEARYGAYHVAMFILSIASLMLCYLFYQTKLIPRFISVVGLIGYALVLLSAPLDILGIIDTTGAGGIMYVPGALFELFLLPIWLIGKGFNSSTVVSGSA
jgi:hypothetical protein